MKKSRIFSNFKNISKSVKIIFFVSLLVVSLATFEIVTIYAHHGTLTRTNLDSGSQVISFRNIDNINPTTSTIEGLAIPGQVIEITVTDADANIDSTAIDFVLSSATSTTSGSVKATTTLTETSPITGIFTGTIILSSSTTSGSTLQATSSDEYRLFYEPHDLTSTSEQEFVSQGGSLGWPRAKATVDLSSGGDVTIADFEIDNNELVNLCFRPVTHATEISFSNGAVQNAGTDMEVTISYANAIFVTGDNPALLKMFYKEPGQGFEVVRDNFNTQGHDSAAKTITSVPNQVFFIGDVTKGQFILGFETGCGGGGGGGLVRPGLVVNALAGISASGGGGSGPPGPTLTLGALALYDSAVEIISMPQEIRDIALNYDPYTPLEIIFDIYEDFDLPFSINGNGFVLGGYENTIETQTIEPGELTEFVIVYYTNSELAHSSLNFNLGPTRTIAGSDTQVLLYNDKPPEIVDPNGNIASFTGSINNEGDLKRVATFLVTFSESVELPNPDIVIRSWTDNFSSGDTIIYDAIEIAQPEIVEIADEDLPEPEIQTLKSQYVPIWIKNNAAWWSQELIEDSDFIAGIEYLIQQEIITLTESGTLETNSYDEIPNWIKNNAGWWSEDLITEKEFIDGLQWLIGNGIIQVTET